MSKKIDYQITHKDFLIMAAERPQDIFLCKKEVITKPNFDLGIKETYAPNCKRLLGFITDILKTIPTDENLLVQKKEIIAKISCSSLTMEELTPDSRIIFEGGIYKIKHKALYTHRKKRIYHELELIKRKDISRENTLIEENTKMEEEEEQEKFPNNLWDLLE